jgi:hypothetical protein
VYIANRVRGAQRLPQTQRNLLEQLVSGEVSERVVHIFESIEVNDAQGEWSTVAVRHANRLVQAVLQ